MLDALDKALKLASPRLSPPPTPLRSVLIHGTIFTLWIALFARAFYAHDVFSWSVGIVYVAYDTVLLVFVSWQTLALLKPQDNLPSIGARPTLGIIVAAHNEASVLPITLAALAAQDDPPDQIFIADDGSSDATMELLASRFGMAVPAFGQLSAASPANPALRWLRLPHGGKAKALNAALLEIDTEIVLTVDADTLLEPDAIGAMRHAFATDPALVAATGVITPICGTSISGRFFQWFQTYEYVRNFLARYAWMRVDSLLLISGAFAGFRRHAVLAVGGFDPACLVEDYELIHRLRRYGVTNGLTWRTSVVGAALAKTDAPSEIGAFLRQRRRWFAGFLQTQYWYRDMVGDRRYGWLGLAMLPVKAVDTLQPIYGLTALFLLGFYLVTGRLAIAGPVAFIIWAKIVIDLGFHLWSVQLYRRWVGGRTSAHLGYAIIAALAEPFSFQVLRHTGASWGWLFFLTGRQKWGVQQRIGVVPQRDEA